MEACEGLGAAWRRCRAVRNAVRPLGAELLWRPYRRGFPLRAGFVARALAAPRDAPPKDARERGVVARGAADRVGWSPPRGRSPGRRRPCVLVCAPSNKAVFVVLEEFAASDILDFLGYAGFGAQAVQEERSFMSGKLGSRVMGSNVTIWDDPTHPTSVPRPFDAEGMPAQRVDLVVGGVAGSPVYDRRTAAKEGRQTTGHALPAAYPIGPMPRNLFLLPGDTPRADLVRTVKRGLLVTRFWYTRVVHPLTVLMTGMTRDGTFLVEDGEIVAAVENLRFTESYVEAMNRVEAMSRETKLVREFFSTNRVPALRIKGWRFTGR